MAKKVPKRRNNNSGKFTGRSEYSRYFATHPKAKKKKNEYNTKYHEMENRKDYRVELNSYNDNYQGKGDASSIRSGKNGNSSKK